jgi:hypothetical protein
MADSKEKKILIDVEVKAKEALKSYAELKIQVDDLKEDQKVLKKAMDDCNTSTNEGVKEYARIRQEYESVGQEIKGLNTRAQEYQKEIQSNIKYQHEAEGSLQKLKQELSLNTAAFNKLSEAERNTVKGSMIQKQIQETTDKLKEEEDALGNHRRSVGDYEKAGKSLRSEMKELVEQLTRMKLAGDDNSETFQTMNAKLAELRDAFGDVSQGANQLASDTNKLDATTQIVSTATGAFAAYQAVIASGAEVSDEYLEVMKNMQIAMTALTAITAIQNNIQKQTIAYQKASQLLQKIGITQTVVQAKAEAALTVIKGKGTIATKAIAAAQWLWNTALAANPVILIAMAIIALIAGITALSNAFSSSAKAQKEAKKASEAYEVQQQKTAAAIDRINNAQKNAADERNNRLREEIVEMRKNGSTAEQIAKVKARAEQDARDIEIKASKDRERQKYEEYKASMKNIEAAQKARDEMGKGSKKYKEQAQAVRELIKAHNELAQSIQDERQSQINANLESAEAAQDAAEANRKKYQDNALKMLDTQKQLQDEQNKLTEVGMSQDFLKRQEHEKKKFEQSQKHEKEKLDMERKFGRITTAEAKAREELLGDQAKTFQQNQLKGAQEYYKQQKEALLALIGKDVDTQIAEMKDKYAEAMKAFGDIPKPEQLAGESNEDFSKRQKEYNDFVFHKFVYERELTEQMAKDEKEIRDNSLANILKDNEDALNEKYAGDLAKFTDNEREKNRIEQEMQKERSASALAAIDEEYAKRAEEIWKNAKETASTNETIDEESQKKMTELEAEYQRKRGEQLAKDGAADHALQSQQNQLNLNAELLEAANNAKAKYDTKKAYLEKEMELYADNADKQKELAAEVAEVDREYLEARIAKFEEWSGRTMDGLGAMDGLMKAIEAGQLQRYEEDNEAKKASLDARLNAGTLSQEAYDAGVAKLDADLDKKKAEIARKQAIRERLMKVFEIGMNTAAAVMKNTAQLGLPLAIPANILTIALGAVQAATVLATPLPKASRGKLLHGPSHAAGGTIIEAEGGEAIINRRSVSMFAPLLSAINEAGGGVPFVRPLSDGGYAARSAEQRGVTVEDMKMVIEETVSKMRVYTTIEDIRRGEKRYAEIEERATY